MAFEAGNVVVRLSLIARGFTQGVNAAQQKTEALRQSLDQVSQGLSGIATRSAAAFAGLTAGIAIATKIGSDFQDAIVNVGAVAGASGKQLQNLEKIALDAGDATKFSATEAARAMFNLASQGVKSADAFKNLLKPALDLAAASQSNVNFTSEALLTTLKAFDLEFDEASRVANIFSAANENSALTAERLAAALRPVAGLAGGLGEGVGILEGLRSAR